MAELDDMRDAWLAGVERHEAHRSAWRLDPDGFYRCRECDPVPPSPWIQLIPHLPRNPVARGYWFVARAVVMWWDRAVDAVREWRRR